MSTINPSLIFSKLENLHIIFRLFLLGALISTYSASFLLVISTYKIMMSIESQIVSILFPSIVIGLIVLTPSIKQKINSKQQELDFFIDKSDKSENLQEKQTIQETEKEEKPKEETAEQEPIIQKSQISDIDKKQLKEIKDNIQKIQSSIQEIKLKQKSFEKETLEIKTKIQDLKRKGSTKLEDLESAYAKIMAFKAEIDNPFNFIDKYFKLLNHPELFKKNLPKNVWKLLKDTPQLEEPDKETKN